MNQPKPWRASPPVLYIEDVSDDSKLPVPVGNGEALDPYETQYMTGQGEAVLQVKTRTNWHAPAYAGGMAVFIFIWCAMHAHLGVMMGLGMAATSILTGLFFAVLRVKVTTECVDIHYGMIGPKIPLSSIESVKPTKHDHQGFMRWGISPLGRKKWLYSVPGDGGSAIEIVWRGRRGNRRTHIVSSQDPEQLAASIESARQGRALAESSSERPE